MTPLPGSKAAMSRDESAMLMPQALYSAEAEKAVVGCMMAQPDEVIEEACEVLTANDFFVPAHRTIFIALRNMFNSKAAIDVMTIHQWLTDLKQAEEVGSPGILGELLVGFATHLNVGSYIRIVKDKSLLRSLQAACAKIVQDIVDMPDSVASIIDRAESAVFAVTGNLQTESIVDARSAVEEFRRHLKDVEEEKTVPLITTGIKPIDELVGGLPCPSYLVVAAPPGGGKSALMMTLAENWSSSGTGVGIFSLEMTVQKLISRRVANVARINSRSLNWKLDVFQKDDVRRALDHIATTPMWIDPTSNLVPSDLRARVRKMVRLGAKVIMLDYIQLLRGSNGDDRRVDQLTEASRTISVIQKEMDVLFIVFAQLTRKAQEEGNYKTFHIADCAGISNDARGILFLEPNKEFTNYGDHEVPLIGRFAKMSEGQTGDCYLTFNKLEQRIS